MVCWIYEGTIEAIAVQSRIKFVPTYLCGSLLNNAVMGVIIWEDWRAVYSWTGYVAVFILLLLGVYLMSDLEFFKSGEEEMKEVLSEEYQRMSVRVSAVFRKRSAVFRRSGETFRKSNKNYLTKEDMEEIIEAGAEGASSRLRADNMKEIVSGVEGELGSSRASVPLGGATDKDIETSNYNEREAEKDDSTDTEVEVGSAEVVFEC
jgi:hypothetical protein